MNYFNGYCYSTLSEASTAEISGSVVAGLSGAAVPVSFSAINTQSGTLVFNTSAGTSYSLVRTYPTCAQVGYQHNFSGLSLADVSESSFMVLAVWAAVWGIKVLRRGL